MGFTDELAASTDIGHWTSLVAFIVAHRGGNPLDPFDDP
ncbi:hypothetical protein FHS63_005806 [Azospirillum doebereinerae]